MKNNGFSLASLEAVKERVGQRGSAITEDGGKRKGACIFSYVAKKK